MIRLLAVMTALVAVFLTAPASAFAITYVVNDNGDASDADTLLDPDCDTDTDPTNGLDCTLRAAIEQANATAGADIINFTAGGQAPAPLTPLPAITEQLSIDGGGATTVAFDPAATGVLLDAEAANTLIKSIGFTGGGSATTIKLGAQGDRLDTVGVHDVTGTAVLVAGDSSRVDGSTLASVTGTGIQVSGSSATVASPTITSTSGAGIAVTGSSASISNPEISGGGGDGITLMGSGGAVNGGHIHDNHGNGVGIAGQNDAVSHVVFNSNGGKPILTSAGANGGIGPPQNLRIGPRRADGTLPLTGTGPNATLELWSGDPSSTTPPLFLDSFHIGGDFTYNFANEPSPGSVFAVGLIGDGLGSAEFATVSVPADVSSPDLTFARALDTSNVRVDFSEPLDPASVQNEDFHLTMAGADRQITSSTVAPDGRFVTLSSSGWRAGEAGVVELTGVGAVTDSAGNAILSAPRVRVAAAPGDFIAPLGGKLSITPRTICLSRGKGCRKPGMTIKFTTTEAGKARMLIKRSDKTLGSRLYANIVPGTNTLKFNGRLGARKLRAGRYRLLMYVQDVVGNVTDQPPIQLFNVRRTTK